MMCRLALKNMGLIAMSAVLVAVGASCKDRRPLPDDAMSTPPPIVSSTTASSPSSEEAMAAGYGTAHRPIVWHASPRNLTLNNSHVFFTDDHAGGTVYRVPKNGGVVEVLATSRDGLGRVAANETNVYWTTRRGSVIVASASKSMPTVLLRNTDLGGAVDLATDAAHVYVLWAESIRKPDREASGGEGGRAEPKTTRILRIDSGGNEPTVLLSANGRGQRITVDATGIYWTDAETGVMKLPLGGRSPIVLVPPGTLAPHPWEIALSETEVYFNDAVDHRLRLVSKHAGAVQVLHTGADTADDGLAVVHGIVNFSGANPKPGRGILRIPAYGGSVTALCCEDGGGEMTADGDALFVASTSTGTVLRITE
jgi:hypothetical protein